MKKANIRDVAAYVGVAASTVSRVLNRREASRHTSEETRKKILEAAQALNYTPNINAKRLFSERSNVIGLVLPSCERHGKHVLTDYHLSGIFSGLEEGLNDTNYRLLLVFNDKQFESRKEYLSLFTERSVDGMLIWGAYSRQQFGMELAKRGFPTLYLTPPESGMDTANYVVHDYRKSGRLALQYLLDKGHRQILWAGAAKDNAICKLLESGFAELGESHSLLREYGDFTRTCGKAIAESTRQAHPQISAILAANEDVRAGLLDGYGGACPEVVVCDYASGTERESFARVCVDDLALAKQAVLNLLDLIEEKQKKVHLAIPVKFMKPGE